MVNFKFESTQLILKKKTEQTECIPVHTCTITSGTSTSWNKYQYFLWWSQPPAKNSLQEPTCSKRSWCAYQSDKHPIRQGLLLKSITSSYVDQTGTKQRLSHLQNLWHTYSITFCHNSHQQESHAGFRGSGLACDVVLYQQQCHLLPSNSTMKHTKPGPHHWKCLWFWLLTQ